MHQHKSFEVHIHELHLKVIGILLLVNRIRDKFDAAARKIVMQSFALSGINYCLQVYGTADNTQMQAGAKVAKLRGKD